MLSRTIRLKDWGSEDEPGDPQLYVCCEAFCGLVARDEYCQPHLAGSDHSFYLAGCDADAFGAVNYCPYCGTPLKEVGSTD